MPELIEHNLNGFNKEADPTMDVGPTIGADPIKHINKKVEGFFSRLVEFLKEWSVIGVALGVIVAQAAKDFVDAVVRGLIIPFFKLIFHTDELSSWSFAIGAVKFDFGAIISSFITLIIVIAFLYYFIRRIMKKYGQD